MQACIVRRLYYMLHKMEKPLIYKYIISQGKDRIIGKQRVECFLFSTIIVTSITALLLLY